MSSWSLTSPKSLDRGCEMALSAGYLIFASVMPLVKM